jgi:hypothetical protein
MGWADALSNSQPPHHPGPPPQLLDRDQAQRKTLPSLDAGGQHFPRGTFLFHLLVRFDDSQHPLLFGG